MNERSVKLGLDTQGTNLQSQYMPGPLTQEAALSLSSTDKTQSTTPAQTNAPVPSTPTAAEAKLNYLYQEAWARGYNAAAQYFFAKESSMPSFSGDMEYHPVVSPAEQVAAMKRSPRFEIKGKWFWFMTLTLLGSAASCGYAVRCLTHG